MEIEYLNTSDHSDVSPLNEGLGLDIAYDPKLEYQYMQVASRYQLYIRYLDGTDENFCIRVIPRLGAISYAGLSHKPPYLNPCCCSGNPCPSTPTCHYY